ncbi:MAG: hypothetical protein KatS3mg111_3478 [Pirellulaceae bacterium]|nr:MAG: hypothetical protein KatS3mg111_3478 [Pirellulaceae bacterium]
MSPVRLYVDEDACELAVIMGLRARGVDLLTTLESGRVGASDEDQLAFAAIEQRTLYTFNIRDFARLHWDWLQRGSDHSGIVVIHDQRYSVGEKIRLLSGFVASRTADEMVNRMEFL